MKKNIVRSFKVLLFLFYLEIFLRCGGPAFIVIQDVLNYLKMSQPKDIVVLCAGDSMTAHGGYPAQLENILNSVQNKKKFSVINRGIPSGSTLRSAVKIARSIKEFKVDAVVLMSGLEDQVSEEEEFKNEIEEWRRAQLVVEADSGYSRLKTFFSDKELFRRKLIIAEIIAKSINHLQHDKMDVLKNQMDYMRALLRVVVHSQRQHAWLLLGTYSLNAKHYNIADFAFQKMISCPDFDNKYRSIIQVLLVNKEFERAERWINLAYAHLSIANRAYYIDYYLDWNVCKPTERWIDQSLQYFTQGLFKKIITVYYQNGEYQKTEKWIYWWMKKHSLKDIDPAVITRISEHLYNTDRIQEASDILTHYINAKSEFSLWILYGDILKRQRKYNEAEKAYLKAASDVTRNEILRSVYTKLGEVYDLQNKKEDLAGVKKILNLIPKDYTHFQEIHQLLSKQHIPLIAVQYPFRDIEDLKRRFEADHNIYFVDNKQLFLEAGAKQEYFSFFTDYITDDFGHFTPRGAKLLAGNVAQTIIHVFNNVK